MTPGARSPRASVVIRCVVAAAGVGMAVWLIWGLKSLIVPAAVGGLLAYICRPLVAHLERYWIPRGVAVGLLLLMIGLAVLVVVNSVRTVMPSETGALELRVRALYALNHQYQTLMGHDPSWTRGNRLYQLTHREVDPLVDRLSELLALTPEERAQFVAASARSSRPLEHDRANVEAVDRRARRAAGAEPAARAIAEPPSRTARTSGEDTPPAALGSIFSTWMISPLIFLFLLSDAGTIKRGLLSAVPNRLFEPALAVLADLDEAFGKYARGMFLECCSLGLTVMVFIAIIGVPLRWAVAIGLFTGASNTVPYMGFAAALLSGLAYALLAEDIHPLLPLVTPETFVIWMVAAVALAELLKNVIYEPLVLGRAVELHPLVMVIGVVGGAILFGPAGMFLAIPTITVVRVLVASTVRYLTSYGLI